MKRILLLLILSVCLLPLWAQEAVALVKPLSARIDALIEHKLPAGSNVAISVYDLTAGKPLYGYQADKLSRPASTMKLLTTITALARPEADEPFRTEVWYQGTIERDTLQGDVYVIGGFDPEFDEEALDSLVAAVARFPFSVIRGKVYGDVSMKDSLYWGSGWLWDDTPYSFQPYLSPLMLNKGVVKVTATPGERGDSARLECTPASSYYTLTNKTQSRTPSAGRFRVSRDWLVNGNNITVTGNVDARRTGTVNIFSSQDFFMHTFMERLQARGIRCIPTAGAESEAFETVVKPSAVASSYLFGEFRRDSLSVRMAFYETPVQDVVKQIMKESDNLNAEAMLCRLGVQSSGKKRVSAEDGLSAVRMLIKKLGHNPDRYNLADGCGLSNYNYISPELLVSFLRYAYSRTDVFRKLYKALPIGGVDGTLEFRMKKGTPSHRNVHAKTGSFTAVNCLAGYLKARNGHEIAFAVMNQNALSGREARAFQDAVCDEVIR
ncbi:D-alanyl-D-alanine carboxypeptidase/D-alanyl-D-alanine endopeptidase [Bacteroides muris (ex Fokt et al. 2023)]|uniref:D-alanyl-D-alanine carboxypeptidase/D-alanyl-D-alanine-endopeptidase n=1 Tax=Bacteroides muris (ex Fokt et al. 2023) TaxID=2937417 RepID=A0A9X2SSE5_9BACE|nr:D-alanyl-D-alanine carboxypeptidase/D-alanyl-D-alanine-endopeptidase [Bacteroides muris (ex Fokt et al. 2023)]MCR6504869.1 D-alanyl-D-alanine carboxypeptidase/D-alanyl-D-alanine-endopeptidase [Bacteroides muris (ex Fokt et al. 2023)]